MVAQLETHQGQQDDPIEKTKSLICALNFVSRNLPLPPDVYDSVSSIYYGEHDPAIEPSGCGSQTAGGSDRTEVADKVLDNGRISSTGDLLSEFEDALSRQRPKCASGSELSKSREILYRSHIQHRLHELEELPSSRGEDMQTKCLLELYGLKLAELQSKVRSDVSSEYWLQLKCAYSDKQLFDWGMMRLRRPLYGVGDPFAMEADDQFRKKRDAERLSRLEEEERNHVETRKRKFFAEILNAVREFQLQIQASLKRRKQRNDGIQAWHGRQRQRATRAEKLRFQALKADDQEAYMRLVKESKNERLTILLEETNKLLVNLGAAVQRQKDAKQSDGIETSKGSESDLSEVDAPKDGTPQDSFPDKDVEITDSDNNDDSNDLLEGQRQYNSAIHSIQEKVTEQPSILQGGELRSYQLEGLQWMLSLFNNNLNGILADEMGLGKTIQTISLIAYLLENKGVAGPHLIVAPKAVLPNWINEFSTWAPSIAAVLYDGRLDERKAMRDELSGEGKFNVLITHYDLIMRDKAFLKKINWFYMIVDEGHRLKNHECALARTLITGYRIQRRLLLTGTPIQNSLQELWSLLNFLLPNIFNSVQNFEEWFNAPFADRGDVSLTDEEELLIIRRLHHVIRPFILRRKKDEVEKFLPGKSQVILKCDMSAWQKVYYQQVTDVGRVGLHTGSGKSKSLQNLSMQLRKCCNHPYLFVGGDYDMWKKADIVRASGKFELLDRLLPKLRRAGHRVLLFSQMTRLMDILEIYLTLNDFKYLRLDGTTKTEQRGALLKQFNAPDSPYFMFLLSTRAGGLGLNLQTADTVIIFDSDWNPQMDQQAEDRAHRIGQKKEVRVFVLVSVGSIEEVILERAKQKMGIDAKVIQAGLFNTTSTAQDRREMLEEIMRRGTSSLGTDVPSEREINRLAARSDEEFWLFEKMDEERRQRENYRSRLMEEHEVPEWAYTAPANPEDKAKGSEYDSGSILGKRRRKEVVYSDSLSDIQWMKAVENGEDLSKFSIKGKRRDHLSYEAHESPNNDAGVGRKVVASNNSGLEKKAMQYFKFLANSRTFRHTPLTYRVMIKKLAQECETDGVHYLLQQMKLEGFSCSEDLFVSVINSYQRMGLAEQALKMFYRIREFRCTPTVKIYNHILDALLSESRFQMINSIYRSMKRDGMEPNVFTYNILLKALCKNNRVDGACKLLIEMSKKGCSPDAVSYTTIVSSMCKLDMVDEARELVVGFKPVVSVYNALVKGLCRESKFREVFGLLRNMVELDIDPNVITYSTIINSLCDVGNIELSLAVLGQMFERGCDPNIWTFTSLLKGCFMRHRLPEAFDLWSRMIREGFLPNVIAYNTLIHGLCVNQNVDEALSVFHQMEKKGCRPNVTTYTSLIDGFAKAGSLVGASEIWNKMVINGCWPNVVTYTCMVDLLCQHSMFSQAQYLIEKMAREHCPPNAITFNVLINSLCGRGRVEWALEVLDEMGDYGCLPNITTYNELLHGLSKVNKINEAFQLSKEIEERGMKWSLITYNILLYGLSRAGMIKGMLQLIWKMLMDGKKPDVSTYNMVLLAYCKKGMVSAAIQLLDKTSAGGEWHPDIVSYTNLLWGICNWIGVEEATRFLHNMINEGIRPNIATWNVLVRCFFCNLGHLGSVHILDNIIGNAEKKSTGDKYI